MLNNLSFDISSIRQAYLDGLSPEELVKEVFRRIYEIDDEGIFITLLPEQDVLKSVEKLGTFHPEGKPLWGIPFAVKDNIDVAGLPTTAACPDYEYMPQANAFVVQKLLDAGALVIGKTNLDQFATGLVGVRTPYPVPKNALDPEIVPGGSSSGSAVAVAHGIVSFALGTDTAGSGRVPAALNNIVGLKPSLGSLSASGVVPACRTLDTISVFAMSVDDAYQAFEVACGYDEADAYSKNISIGSLGELANSFSVGIPDEKTIDFKGDDVQRENFAASVKQIQDLGGKIVELDFKPFYDVAAMLYEGAWVAERYAAIEEMLVNKADKIFPVTRQIIEGAEQYSAADAFKGYYKLQSLKRVAAKAMKSVDLLCVPTIPTFYSLVDLENDAISFNSYLGLYTNFVNLMDLCAIAVPTQPRSDNRPGSVTLLAGSGEDGKVASLARQIHQMAGVKLGATGHVLDALPPVKAAVHDDEIVLCAVGAHMSGLPLNHELTGLGGRFLYRAQTAPQYKLYKLAGDLPLRPGLIRQEEGGHSIDLEVWALPKKAFGEFMSAIPHPLGIGTLSLANGENIKGFICEPIALNGATDVSEYGGWRSYLSSLS